MRYQRRRSARVICALVPALVLVLLSSSASPVYAVSGPTHFFAGEMTDSSLYPDGVDGYIRQSLTGSIGGIHADWISICSATCSNSGQWLETGEIQGYWRSYSYPTTLHVFTEVTDERGRYEPLEWDVPPANQAYYIQYDGSHWAETCPAGQVPARGVTARHLRAE